jgi:RNA binding activity-knot of a chromodomain./Caspase domain.
MPTNLFLGWEPSRIWVFMVGILEWKRDDIYEPFPKENRRDVQLIQLFRKQGIPSQQIVYLQDQQATTETIEKRLEQHLKKSSAGDLLFVYYCGHGTSDDDDAFLLASYDADDDENLGWYGESLITSIEKHFNGSHAMIVLDCCQSGSMLDLLPKRSRKVSYACLASSLANESSTANWTFTEGLIMGLQGLAFVDANHDKSITLRELFDQLAENMAFAEEQVSVFGTTGKFDPHLVVASARPSKDPRIGKRVEAFDGNDWYRAQIVDARGERVKVHYFGYEESDQEWLEPDCVREVVWKRFEPGSKVEVRWHGEWYDAKVLKVHGGIHLVHYEGYDDDDDEWVPSKRIRQSKTTK